MLAVTFQHPCPYFDDSYAVNSVNVGPYGDAIVKELIPEIERRFRAIPEPYARVLTGAIATQTGLPYPLCYHGRRSGGAPGGILAQPGREPRVVLVAGRIRVRESPTPMAAPHKQTGTHKDPHMTLELAYTETGEGGCGTE